MAKIARKTVEVGTLLHRVNYFLKNAPQHTFAEREVLCTFIEGTLHDTGNYRGYAYLDTAEIEGNGSRRHYFVSGKIDADYEAAAALVAKHYYGKGI
jgi:hypothetical protein